MYATNTAFELFLVFERACRDHLNESQVTKSCHQIDVKNIVTTLLSLDEVALLWADMTAEHLGDTDTANKMMTLQVQVTASCSSLSRSICLSVYISLLRR